MSASSLNCHIYGVPTTMPQKVEATLTSASTMAGHGIIVKYGTELDLKTVIYGIHAGEDVFYGVNDFNWANRTTIRNDAGKQIQIYQEKLEKEIRKPTTQEGEYTYNISAVVKDGYLNVIYNGEVVFVDYLLNYKENDVVHLGLYAYSPKGEEDCSCYTNVLFNVGEDIEVLDIDRTSANTELSSVLTGKKISILGDSISTYPDVSNGTMASKTNSTIENNPSWYSAKHLSSWTKTYWGRIIDKYNMSLCVNNSASGGWVSKDVNTTRLSGIKRCVELHNNTGKDAGTEPEIIAVYLGTNDLIKNVPVGKLTRATYEQVKAGEKYIEPSTFTEAYIILLDKIVNRYQDADIFCFTLLPTSNDNNNTSVRDDYNARIKAIAAHYGDRITVVDIATNSGIISENFKSNFVGSHPLFQSIYKIFKVFEDALETKYCKK